MSAAAAEHPAVAAWRTVSDETLTRIDPAIPPGKNGQQDALRRLFLRQRHDYHRARFMYSAIALASTKEQAQAAPASRAPRAPARKRTGSRPV